MCFGKKEKPGGAGVQAGGVGPRQVNTNRQQMNAGERQTGVKAEKQNPAKAEKQKAPAKAEKQKAPAKTEKQKTPAKAEKQKAPAKAEKQKAPAKAEKQKNPAKTGKQQPPTKAGKQQESVKVEKQPVKAGKQHSQVEAKKRQIQTGRQGQIDAIPSHAGWAEQPKDDESLVSLFREVDTLLTDHVINYYIDNDGTIYEDEVSKIPKDVRQRLEKSVPRFDYLIRREDSRKYALRAIIANRIIKAVSEGVINSDSSALMQEKDRKIIIDTITNTTFEDTNAFYIPSQNRRGRLDSMSAVVKAVVDFAFTIARQPSRLEFIWEPPTPEELSRNAYEPSAVEVVFTVPSIGMGSKKKVEQATVFPGLGRRLQEGKITLLERVKVLVF